MAAGAVAEVAAAAVEIRVSSLRSPRRTPSPRPPLSPALGLARGGEKGGPRGGIGAGAVALGRPDLVRVPRGGGEEQGLGEGKKKKG